MKVTLVMSIVSLPLRDINTVWAWRAFEWLISEWYRSYILTVECIAVGISFYADNGQFKVFDSTLSLSLSLTRTWGTWSIRYIIYRQLSASLSKFIWSNWSVQTKRFTNYKIWCVNKQQYKSGIKEISGQHKCYKNHCFAIVLYSTLLNHLTL